MANLEDLASALGISDKKPTDWTSLGYVTAVGSGTLTANAMGASVEAADFCGADVGDVVLLLVSGGQARAVARKGGGGGGGGSKQVYYTTCSTSASTAAKVITVAGRTPAAGDVLAVLFSTANTTGIPTLKVNGTTYNIRIGDSSPSSTANTLKWTANTMLYFLYDGTYFRYITARAAASIVSPDGAGSWYATCSTSATTAAKVGTCDNFRLSPGAVVHLQCSAANTKADAAITLNVNSTGAKTIYANGAATSASNTLTWSAGDMLTFVYSGTYWYYCGGATADVKIAQGKFMQLVTATSGTVSGGDWNATVTATIPTGYAFVCWVLPRTNGWVGDAYVGGWSVNGSTAEANMYWSTGGSGTVSVDALCIWKG